MPKRIKEQFNRNAKSYLKYSIIQQKGAEILCSSLPDNLGSVLDLGCGSGRIYSQLLKSGKIFSSFTGIDFAKDMLQMHPKAENVTLIEGDFNNPGLFKNLNADVLISASALQWAEDLPAVFENCTKSAKIGAFFIFTSGTFNSLHRYLGVKSPIKDAGFVKDAFLKFYKPKIVKKFQFEIEFQNGAEMLRYIKKSGVSGGGQRLGYKRLKKLIEENQIKHLEFEALLLTGES